MRDLCRIYGVSDEAQVGDLMTLASQAREPGWWNQTTNQAFPYLGLEQEAAAITAYSMSFVPALLQTREYARATIQGIDRKMDAAVLDQRVEARIRRKELLERPDPPRTRALLDQTVLRRQVVGPIVMPAQLEMVSLRGGEADTVQVNPFDLPSTPAPTAISCCRIR